MKDEVVKQIDAFKHLSDMIDAEIFSDIWQSEWEGSDTAMKDYEPRNRAFSVAFHEATKILDNYNW